MRIPPTSGDSLATSRTASGSGARDRLPVGVDDGDPWRAILSLPGEIAVCASLGASGNPLRPGPACQMRCPSQTPAGTTGWFGRNDSLSSPIRHAERNCRRERRANISPDEPYRASQRPAIGFLDVDDGSTCVSRPSGFIGRPDADEQPGHVTCLTRPNPRFDRRNFRDEHLATAPPHVPEEIPDRRARPCRQGLPARCSGRKESRRRRLKKGRSASWGRRRSATARREVTGPEEDDRSGERERRQEPGAKFVAWPADR